MGKTFAEYQAEHLKEPFPLPMPDGTTVPLPLASIDEQRVISERIAALGEDATPFTGVEVLVGDAAAAKIAEAWGKLPGSAWDAVMTDRREHFGQGNSGASPTS